MTHSYGSWDEPQDTGPPDAVETDPAALNSAEDLDEDRLHADPLEKGMDPPEDWTGVTEYGMTPYEQAHDRGLDERLAEEEPDVFDRVRPGEESQADDARPAEAAAVRTGEEERRTETYEEHLGISADG
ncbi:hypothetical protein [Nocardia shimofusensis]|uniref:hypothetical protein n=1 Tax=Nocardia shimofusensis TaxID=228596 RepID=UPI00082D17D3|nr:hypothetical protein [Nocardia shimofusensis]